MRDPYESETTSSKWFISISEIDIKTNDGEYA